MAALDAKRRVRRDGKGSDACSDWGCSVKGKRTRARKGSGEEGTRLVRQVKAHGLCSSRDSQGERERKRETGKRVGT